MRDFWKKQKEKEESQKTKIYYEVKNFFKFRI